MTKRKFFYCTKGFGAFRFWFPDVPELIVKRGKKKVKMTQAEYRKDLESKGYIVEYEGKA